MVRRRANGHSSSSLADQSSGFHRQLLVGSIRSLLLWVFPRDPLEIGPSDRKHELLKAI